MYDKQKSDLQYVLFNKLLLMCLSVSLTQACLNKQDTMYITPSLREIQVRGSSGSPNRKNRPKNQSKKIKKKYWKNWKISGPNGLSKCPESREMDFGHFWENIFRLFFGPFFKTQISRFKTQIFS